MNNINGVCAEEKDDYDSEGRHDMNTVCIKIIIKKFFKHSKYL